MVDLTTLSLDFKGVFCMSEVENIHNAANINQSINQSNFIL